MTLFKFIVVYTLTWWLVLFITLPIGFQAEDNVKKGNAASAPKKTYLGWKILASTIISLLLTLLFFYVVDSGYLSTL